MEPFVGKPISCGRLHSGLLANSQQNENMAPRPDFRCRFPRRSRVGKVHLLLKYNAINNTASTSAVGLLVLQRS